MTLTDEQKRLFPEAEAELAKPLHLQDGSKLPPIQATVRDVLPVQFSGNLTPKGA